MDKKEFKEMIKENGFFVKSYGNKITRESVSNATTLSQIPEGENILIFEGVFSQNYKAGEKSRNGYKIDQTGWDFSDFQKNPKLLYQHNQTQPIGEVVELGLNDTGDLTGVFYVNLNWVDTEADKNRIRDGAVRGISTGHITLEDAIEDNETAKRYTIDEAEEKFGRENVWNALRGSSDTLTYVVTKALMLESSLVTIGSNEDAFALKKSLNNSIQNRYSNFINKYSNMLKTNEVTDEVTTEETVDETTDETSEETTTDEGTDTTPETNSPESEGTEGEGEDKGESEEDTQEDVATDATLENAIKELQNSFDEKLEAMKGELQNQLDEKLEGVLTALTNVVELVNTVSDRQEQVNALVNKASKEVDKSGYTQTTTVKKDALSVFGK